MAIPYTQYILNNIILRVSTCHLYFSNPQQMFDTYNKAIIWYISPQMCAPALLYEWPLFVALMSYTEAESDFLNQPTVRWRLTVRLIYYAPLLICLPVWSNRLQKDGDYLYLRLAGWLTVIPVHTVEHCATFPPTTQPELDCFFSPSHFYQLTRRQCRCAGKKMY